MFGTVSENDLVELPDAFGPASNLESLDCSGNKIRVIPPSLRQVPRLSAYFCLRTLSCCFFTSSFLHSCNSLIKQHRDPADVLHAGTRAERGEQALSRLQPNLNAFKRGLSPQHPHAASLFAPFSHPPLFLSHTLCLAVNHNQLETLPDSLSQLTNLVELHGLCRPLHFFVCLLCSHHLFFLCSVPQQAQDAPRPLKSHRAPRS